MSKYLSRIEQLNNIIERQQKLLEAAQVRALLCAFLFVMSALINLYVISAYVLGIIPKVPV